MSVDTNPSFAFLVLALNHQEYILEHLESIKYLVQTHGANWEVDLIVNDDASHDRTKILVDSWLEINAKMFRHIKTLYNPKNLGTCKSVNNMLKHMVADRCKLTAGDDVYSFENIFELTAYADDTSMVMGRPLYLLGNELGVNRTDTILTTATQAIYQKNLLLHRFKHLSYNNAPNLFYATECLLNSRVRDFLIKFDVVEDWPLQVAIAREFPHRRLVLIEKVFVYYRRTQGSTYIVANQRFIKDKLELYDNLIRSEANYLDRLRIVGRRNCFKLQNPLANKLLNFDWYIYLIGCVLKFNQIYKKDKEMSLDIDANKNHYAIIRSRAIKTYLT